MENQIFKDINTDLDLNGPYLSFVTQPSQATASSGSASWVGVATVSFGVSSPENIGSIEYQWYEYTTGDYPYSGNKLTDGSGISGATTTTLTIANLVSGTDDGREFYLEAQYTPAQVDYQTGNPPNEPLNSTKAGVTIAPTINITSQPTTKVVKPNKTTTFTVEASLSDGSGRALSYQWYIDGVAETDRTKNVTINTTTNTPAPFSKTFSDDKNFDLPPSATDIKTQVVAARGGGGGVDRRGPPGEGQVGRGGKFSLNAPSFQGKTLQYRIGSQGSGGGNGDGGSGGAGGKISIRGDGGTGGGAGTRGWSGHGGGAGAASVLLLNQGDPNEKNIIVAGGGGGGGGGSHRAGTPNRSPEGPTGQGKPFVSNPGPVTLTDGGRGGQYAPDGGGGGGGGGGAPGGEGGRFGYDRQYGGDNGNGGTSKYDSSRATLLREFANDDNGWGSLEYTYVVKTPSTEKRSTTFSGTNSSTLTISSDFEATQEVYVIVSFTGATNTPVTSDVVSFNVVPGTGNEMINYEYIDNSGVGLEDKGQINLRNGAYTFQTKVGGQYTDDVISLYPPDKDIDVFIDFYGGRGDEWDAPPNTSYLGGTGGKGGYGRLSMTLKQNQEYVIAGLSTNIGTPFFYEGGTLVAVVGQGGQTGRYARGGDGGSFTTSGSSGNGGTGAGDGGASSSTSPISNTGVFGSIVDGFVNATTVSNYGDSVATGTDGGRTIACTKGVYWRQQGKAACDNLGTVKYRTPNGDEISGSAEITRGFKSGYGIFQTAGAADPNSQVGGFTMSGKGGNGANGGEGATNGAGGGGGGGYISPVATIVSEQSGENDDYGKIIIRLKE